MHKGTRWRIFMIAASYFFYGYWNWRFAFLVGASTVWNQAWGHTIHRLRGDRGRKSALLVAVAGNLGVLAWFKYYRFFIVSATNLLGELGIHISPRILSVTLPVGISFFTFQALSYVIDVYRRELEPVRFLDFALFVSFFPQLVAGPIVRASEFLPQLESEPRFDDRKAEAGLGRILF